jgi:hypothetical protein
VVAIASQIWRVSSRLVQKALVQCSAGRVLRVSCSKKMNFKTSRKEAMAT